MVYYRMCNSAWADWSDVKSVNLTEFGDLCVNYLFVGCALKI